MKKPHIDIVPLRPAVCSDAPTTLDVLVRIVPPDPEGPVQRPALNLGLVLDHSGSMAGNRKLAFAREAATYAVQQLLSTDRVGVTIFDDEVQTIVQNTLAEDKPRIVELIQHVQPGGSTALHAGWTEGGKQVGGHPLPGGLNRVLLLSDGLANVGESNPDVIATDVKKLAVQGVSTTTMGVGDDYNEDLMEAMARSGDGNYYFIDSPKQLPDFFQTELRGLMATVGNTVSLGLEPQDGVAVEEVLNELDLLPTGRLKLPNLIAGMPVLVVVRLRMPPVSGERELCRFRLAWNDPKSRERKKLRTGLVLPDVPLATWQSIAANSEVEERATLLIVARLKKQATQLMQQGNLEAAKGLIAKAKALIAAAARTPEIERELQYIAEVEADLESGAYQKFTKSVRK